MLVRSAPITPFTPRTTSTKFDLSKIGTGEGAQVYGHGLYFAENPAVSGQGGQYWNQFTQQFDKAGNIWQRMKLKAGGRI